MREGPVGAGAGMVASVVHTTVFCAPMIILLEPDTLFELPFTVLLFPPKILVFPLTVLLDPFIVLLLPLPLLLVPSIVLFAPVIVLLDTVKVPVFHKASVLAEVELLEVADAVIGAGVRVGGLAELPDPPEDEIVDVG